MRNKLILIASILLMNTFFAAQSHAMQCQMKGSLKVCTGAANTCYIRGGKTLLCRDKLTKACKYKHNGTC